MAVGIGGEAVGTGVGGVVVDGVERLLPGGDHWLGAQTDEIVEIVEASVECHPLTYNNTIIPNTLNPISVKCCSIFCRQKIPTNHIA